MRLPSLSTLKSRMVWISIVIGALAFGQIASFYPGYLSHDSAYQWWQARSGDITTLWPPGIIFMLQAVARFYDTAPTMLYVLHSVLYWACATYIVAQQPRFLGRTSALGALCVFPIVAVCLPHVWSDVALAVWLLAACVLLDACTSLRLSVTCTRWVVAVAALILIGCTLLRHNAWFALPPLCWWAASRWQHSTDFAQNQKYVSAASNKLIRSTALTAGLLFAVAFMTYATVPRWVSKVYASTWAITLIWDLQALSVTSRHVLLPKSISSDTTVDDLEQSFDRVNAVTLYVKSRAQWANATIGLSSEQKSDLLAAWARAVAQNPLAYLKHRSHVFLKLVGPKRGVDRDGSADDPGHVQFKDNPRVEFANPGALRIARLWVDWLKPQWWASPIVWLSCSTIFLTWIIWRRCFSREQKPRLRAAVTPSGYMWLSGMLYLLPLFFLTPTSDLRYALWPTIACVSAALLALRDQHAVRS